MHNLGEFLLMQYCSAMSVTAIINGSNEISDGSLELNRRYPPGFGPQSLGVAFDREGVYGAAFLPACWGYGFPLKPANSGQNIPPGSLGAAANVIQPVSRGRAFKQQYVRSYDVAHIGVISR